MRAVLAGALIGLSFFFKQDSAAGFLIGLAGAVYLVRAWRPALWGAAFVGLLFVVIAASMGLTGAFFRDCFLRAIDFKMGGQAQLNHIYADGWVDRSAPVMLALYVGAALLASLLPDGGACSALCLLWGTGLFVALSTHHFQGYSIRMSTLGALAAIILVAVPRRARESSAALLLLGLSWWGLRYWGNFPRQPYALQTPSLAGLRAPDGRVDELVRDAIADPKFCTLNGLAYFGAGRLPPHPWLVWEDMTPAEREAWGEKR